MDDFMPKPVNVLQLQHKLAKLHRDLRRSRSGDNLNADSGLRIEVSPVPLLTECMPRLDRPALNGSQSQTLLLNQPS